MLSTERFINSFPNPTVQPIIGKPNYEPIRAIHLKLNANAASIQSHLSNGCLGFLAITVTRVVFNILSHQPFIAPINQGLDTIITSGQTAAQITAIRQTQANASKLYKQYNVTDKALK